MKTLFLSPVSLSTTMHMFALDSFPVLFSSFLSLELNKHSRLSLLSLIAQDAELPAVGEPAACVALRCVLSLCVRLQIAKIPFYGIAEAFETGNDIMTQLR